MWGLAVGSLVAILLWGGAVSVAPLAERGDTEQEELFYFPSGKLLKEVSLGYEQAAAALAWLRTVQYYGEHRRTDQSYEEMYHLCNVVAELDPAFLEPYIFGSLVIITEGERPLDGVELLRRGYENNPDSWRILFETGFVYYVFAENHAVAAQYFSQAAAMPDAPEQVRRFAAYVTYQAGELETAYLLWQHLAESSQFPDLREKAERKMEEIAVAIQDRDAGEER